MDAEEKRAYQRAYRAAHPEEFRAYGRRYRETHREQVRARNRQWVKEHREHVREKKRQRYHKVEKFDPVYIIKNRAKARDQQLATKTELARLRLELNFWKRKAARLEKELLTFTNRAF